MAILWTIGLVVLLLSNIWLLREYERTRGRVEQYRAEARAVEERIYRILLEIDMRSHRRSSESVDLLHNDPRD